MYFAGLSTNFCHSMVAISAFVEKLWSTYTLFVLFLATGCKSHYWPNAVVGQCLVGKLTERDCEFIQILLGVFVLQKIEVCYLLLNCWCLLNELDVIVIMINRRLLIEIESWSEGVFSTTILLLYFWRLSVFIVIFPFCGGIKRISALTYDYLAV